MAWNTGTFSSVKAAIALAAPIAPFHLVSDTAENFLSESQSRWGDLAYWRRAGESNPVAAFKAAYALAVRCITILPALHNRPLLTHPKDSSSSPRKAPLRHP